VNEATPPSEHPLVFVEDLDVPRLAPEDHHHLARVLRVRDGAPITLADGHGRWRNARFGASPAVDSDVRQASRVEPSITVAFALVKGQRPELVVQKLTELGVDDIVPFRAERSVVRPDAERDHRRHDRLVRVAREASMQCRRARLPTIADLASFADLAARPGAALAERHGVPPTLEHPTLLIGPEGGWCEAELAAARATVALADLVLRAETAAIVAGALLTGLRAARVGPVRDV
jgi:16S rRNA (uracil1498-N3)-methyltransferase